MAGTDTTTGIAAEIHDWLARGAPETRLAAQRWSLAGFARRDAAWAFGFVGTDGATAPASPCGHDVALAVMARPTDAAAVKRLLVRLAPHFPRRFVLYDQDTPASPSAWAIDGVFVAHHPVAGDFAAQRNRLQGWVGQGWVLQIDADETPSDALLENLGWLTAAASREGVLAIGLPRENHVDGVLSQLYPDIQYRLTDATIRYAGRVHERPVVAFDRSALGLIGPLRHMLSAARVRARSVEHGRLGVDGARQADAIALLTPYEGALPRLASTASR